jgi:hypothetical protein
MISWMSTSTVAANASSLPSPVSDIQPRAPIVTLSYSSMTMIERVFSIDVSGDDLDQVVLAQRVSTSAHCVSIDVIVLATSRAVCRS